MSHIPWLTNIVRIDTDRNLRSVDKAVVDSFARLYGTLEKYTSETGDDAFLFMNLWNRQKNGRVGMPSVIGSKTRYNLFLLWSKMTHPVLFLNTLFVRWKKYVQK